MTTALTILVSSKLLLVRLENRFLDVGLKLLIILELIKGLVVAFECLAIAIVFTALFLDWGLSLSLVSGFSFTPLIDWRIVTNIITALFSPDLTLSYTLSILGRGRCIAVGTALSIPEQGEMPGPVLIL